MRHVSRLRVSLLKITTFFTVSLCLAPPARPQSSIPAEASGRLILVLPFENRSGDPSLSWIGDSFPDTLNQRLNSSGFLTITKDDRQYALDHLGLPFDFRPTRATTIRIAQTLDADFIILGNYNVINGRIVVQASVLDVKQLHLSKPLEDSAQLSRLFDCENAIAWKVARQIDTRFPVAEQTFLAAPGAVKLSAFENYIRGTDSTNSVDRIKRLQQSVDEAPDYSAALLALGKAQYSARQFESAAATLAKVPPTDRMALEANFYLGLTRFNAAKYAEAQKAFDFVASRLPLPEVVNNEGVALSRQGKDSVPLFQRVTASDPNDPDFHFNLAVAWLRRGDPASALSEVAATLKLRPTDGEAAELNTRIAAAIHLTGTPLHNSIYAGGFDPLERIRRTFSEVSFRQQAFLLDQVRASRLSTLPPHEQATQYTQIGYDYLSQGLIPEAEREFQAALSADSNSAGAHAGLAEVRARSGSDADARTEAQTSFRLTPNAPACMVLARLDLNAKDLTAAASDISNALKIDPKNGAALGMKQHLQSLGQAVQ